jgi:hypothetical protein
MTKTTPLDPSEIPESDPEWREKLAAVLADLPAKTEEGIRDLEALLPTLNTFDLLAWISLKNLLIDPENYREGETGGMSLRVEYLTLLTLITGFKQGIGTPPLEQYHRIGDLVDSICRNSLLEQTLRAPPLETPGLEPTLSMLAGTAHMNEMFVRVPGHPHHHERVLRGVFTVFDNDLRNAYGFGTEEAIRLASAVRLRLQRVFDEEIARSERRFADLYKLAKQRRHGPIADLPVGLSDEVLIQWSRLSNKELRKSTRGAGRATAMTSMGHALSFTAAELGEESDVSREVTERFLVSLALNFGEVDNSFRYPTAVHPLKRKPFIHREGRYFTSTPDQILFALQPLFQQALLGSRSQAFIEHRHSWLLAESCALLKRIMPALTVENDLKYPKPDGRQGDEAELDGLGRYDSALFLIEAKAASIRDQAKLGRAAPFRDEMEKVLEAAHEQALRANVHLKRSGVFARKDGSVVAIDVADFTRVFLIGVTLEPLGFLTARMDASNPFALSDENLLFAVGIHDLMVMADCLEGFAPWFPHYIMRRLRLARQGFMFSSDELDLFCYYMERGLYHEGPQDFGDANRVYLGTWTNRLDEYYFYKDGSRQKPATIPQPKATWDLRRFITRLDDSGLRNRLDGILAVVDLGEESRAKFLELRERARTLHRKDGRPHDFSMANDGEGMWGITFAVGTPEQIASLHLTEYVEWKRRQTAVRYWVLLTETGEGVPLGIQLSGQTPTI